MRRIRADRITIGTVLNNSPYAPLYVESISDNSLGDIVLRCSYSPGGYPATTLLVPPADKIEVI